MPGCLDRPRAAAAEPRNGGHLRRSHVRTGRHPLPRELARDDRPCVRIIAYQPNRPGHVCTSSTCPIRAWSEGARARHRLSIQSVSAVRGELRVQRHPAPEDDSFANIADRVGPASSSGKGGIRRPTHAAATSRRRLVSERLHGRDAPDCAGRGPGRSKRRTWQH